MSDNQNSNSPKPQGQIDEQLQRELDEALGGMSLDELIASEEKTASVPASSGTGEAKVRTGKVIAIHGDDIFVNLGGRTEGILPSDQFADEPLPAVGDEIKITIEGYDNQDGLLLLSRQGAVLAAAWETLAEGQIVEGRVTGHNKGGLEMSINGIKAFMPVSQIEMFRVEDMAQYVNQKFQCQVQEVDPAERNVIVSRKALLSLEAQKEKEKFWETVAEGQTVTGTVRNIMPYGAFVSIAGGVDGLLHVKDMSHTRIDDPKKVVKDGQKLELMIIKVDREARKIGLGLKQTLADPWNAVDEKWHEGDIVTGRVTRLAEFGAFVELEPGVEGLVPMGEMSFERRVNKADEVCKAGDVIQVRVLSVEKDRKRISLSIKRVGADPWMGAAVRWKADSIVTGMVKRHADFGAFIELTPGVEGLVHISEISHEHIRSAADALQIGQSVQAKVLEVDEERRRISLSIKQAAGTMDYSAQVQASAEPAPDKPQPKRKKPLKGGLD